MSLPTLKVRTAVPLREPPYPQSQNSGTFMCASLPSTVALIEDANTRDFGTQPYTCSTFGAFWLDLQGGRLPAEEQETTARSCASLLDSCCYDSRNIAVRRCSSFFIYRLTATPDGYMAYCARLQSP